MTGPPTRPDQRGSASLLAATMVVVTAVAAAAVAVLGGVLARQRAVESAADLAALAGAVAAGRNDDGCAAAGRVAVRNGAALVVCRQRTGTVELVAAATAPLPFGQQVSLRARARAGPSSGPVW